MNRCKCGRCAHVLVDKLESEIKRTKEESLLHIQADTRIINSCCKDIWKLEKKLNLMESENSDLKRRLEIEQERIAILLKDIFALRSALIEHRMDLHCGSSRPCPTCRQSAQALGIKVPDRCAVIELDKKALAETKEEPKP